MKKRLLNEKIKAREKIYSDACDRINYKYHNKIVAELNMFRMRCIDEILRLKSNDQTIKKYRKLKEIK